MCTACKNAPACQCDETDCAASHGDYCANCGHEPPEPMPPGQQMMSEDVVFQTHRRRSGAFLALGESAGFVPPPPYYEALLAMARRFVADQQTEFRYELAVILSQMAAELLVEQVLKLLAERNEVTIPRELLWRGQYVRTNLMDERVREFYTLHSGRDQIDTQPFWNAYKAHVDRRDGIVHRGQRASEQDAKTSCEAAGQLIDHLKRTHGAG